jgi:hypothetical protein
MIVDYEKRVLAYAQLNKFLMGFIDNVSAAAVYLVFI